MSDVTSDQFADLRDGLYDAIYDSSLWADAMGQLRRALGASSVAFGYWGDKTTDQSRIYGDCSDEYESLFFNPALSNPFIPALFKASTGAVYNDEALMTRSEFRRTPVYNEWFRPQDEHSYLQAKLPVDGGGDGYLCALRGGRQREFDNADIELVHQVVPVLSRVASLRRRLGTMRLREEAATYGKLDIGYVVVSSSGRVIYQNETLSRMLDSPESGLTIRRGQLALASLAERTRLHAILGHNGFAAASGDMIVRAPETGLPSLALSISPMRDAAVYGIAASRAAVIFVQDLTRRLSSDIEDRIGTLFGLTHKEASLVAALASGQSLQQAADERSVTIATARTQLSQVFRKTQTTQQSQLVSLVLKALPVRA